MPTGVSTADQNPDHQVDALRRAGVAAKDIYVDHASGAKASRPALDTVLWILRDGDTLKITRLDRLGRSVLHLVTLGAELRERGVGLHVTEQGIDTTTAEGRAMFGMLSVLAELQRELILANTRDGLTAARARGRTGGRRPRTTQARASAPPVTGIRRGPPTHLAAESPRRRRRAQRRWRLVTRFSPAPLRPRPGPDLRLVADILGHADVRTTRRYTRSTIEDRRAAMQDLDPREVSVSGLTVAG
ncbi:MAG: recombinase family protein [Solirubrobacteraceae bacterium]